MELVLSVGVGSLTLINQVSYPYKAVDKITVLYILMFTYLHKRRDKKKS
jgi:hypothetical protein